VDTVAWAWSDIISILFANVVAQSALTDINTLTEKVVLLSSDSSL